jgi:CheY-like chemotaxis protein
VDLALLAHELPALLRARVPANVRLEVHGTPEDGLVHGDETQLRQVLMNLVTNAVDAIGAIAGLVTVRVTREHETVESLARCLLGAEREAGEYVVVTVEDSGHGIRSDVIERMFDPFFTTKPTGRGLGLAATLGILNSHAGAIEVQSASGQGTRMRVLLPWSTSVEREGTLRTDDAAPPAGQGTILLVDDDAAVRAAASRVLTRAGFDVVEAEDGVHALSRYDALAGRIACVVLDIAMPRMTGDACLQVLRQRDPALPVLLSTGFDAADVVRGIVERGEAGFLHKPYTARELLQAVHDAMHSSARQT